MKIDLESPEVRRFIRQAMVARIATLSRSGRPSITPLYFNYVDDHIWLGTSSWTLATREAIADPLVNVLLQRERDHGDSRVLRITGSAVVHMEPDTVKFHNRQMAFKYVLSPGGLRNHLLNLRLFWLVRRYRTQNASKGSGCIIEVTPRQAEFLS